MQKITFSCGKTETVYVVPQLAVQDLEELPEYTVENDDPQEEAKRKMLALAQAKADTNFLAAFQDTIVPDDWEYPKWARKPPGQGEDGRKIDYIRYELLKLPGDIYKAQSAMLGELAPAEVAAAEKKFRLIRLAQRLLSPKRRR
jgi:hypothetical protein